MKKKPEILAPAGDWRMLTTAVNNGADAVYFGIEKLNMRAKARNFQLAELPEIVDYCSERNVDTHLTLNTIVYENELADLEDLLSEAKKAKVDLIICWNLSVIQKCREIELPFCISTQASISNSAAAKFYKDLGAKRIVLARECTLKQIKEIKNSVDIEIEAFVHGAMCVAVSGRCFMSHHLFGKSANRGECVQPCRREFVIKDKDQDFEMILGDDYVLSPKDLNTIEFLDQLIDAGIDSFKIEGRKRSPEYIAKAVSVYRKAVDLHHENKFTEEVKKELFDELAKVYNRGFSSGFYFGTPSGDDYATDYGSVATTKKVYIGKVLNYYKKKKIAFIRLEAGDLKTGENIYIIGETTGVVELKPISIVKDELQIDHADKGDEITFYSESLVRARDRVYKIIPVEE